MTSPGTPTWRSDPGLSPLRTRQPSVHLRRPEATAELAYVSVGCNRSVHGVDWNHESGAGGGFVAYGAHKAVAVYDPNGARVVRTLPGHDAPVTVVRWIPDSESPGRWLVSGDADGVVILWHRVDTPWGGNTPKAGGVRGVDPESHKWQVVAKQKAHGAPVLDARAEETVAGGKRTGVRLLVTASQDCCVKLWRLDLALAPAPATGSISDANAAADAGPDADAPKPTGPAFLTQCGGLTFPLKRLPMSAALILVPHTDRVLLAVGGADGGVRLFLCGTDAIDARAARGAESGEKKVTLEPCGSLAGHADWVRDLAFAVDFGDLVARKGSDEQGNTDAERDMDTEKNPIGLLLASASQDRTARVWRLRVANVVETSAAAVDEEAPPAFAALAAPPAPPCTSLGGTARIASVLEALLQGHEDWVMSVAWRPRQVGARGDGRGNGAALLTASADRSLILWTPETEHREKQDAQTKHTHTQNRVWMASESMGDASSSCLGFYGAMFDKSAKRILAHAHGGALHAWRKFETTENCKARWAPAPASAGHAGEVTCLSWDTHGRFLLSGSQDMTARMHASWDSFEEDADRETTSCDVSTLPATTRDAPPTGWREIARPQIHGHRVNCVALLPPPRSGSVEGPGDGSNAANASQTGSGSTTFVSGADEKTLRVFDAPGTFLGTLALSLARGDGAGRLALEQARLGAGDASGGAELPQLGLSNKSLRAPESVVVLDTAHAREDTNAAPTEHSANFTPPPETFVEASTFSYSGFAGNDAPETTRTPPRTPPRQTRQGVMHGERREDVLSVVATPERGETLLSGGEAAGAAKTTAATPERAKGKGEELSKTPQKKDKKEGHQKKDTTLNEKSIVELMAQDVQNNTYTDDNVGGVVPAVYSRAPAEEALASATLWPETRKLYGHGDDLACVAAHPGGTLVASACEARSEASAGVWIWDASGDYRPLGKLPGATLTVVALQFASPKPRGAPADSQVSPSFFGDPQSGAPHETSALLAASRDRHVSIYVPPANAVRNGTGVGAWGTGWTLATRVKAHAKALYDAKWAPTFPANDVFATCGRDKRVKVWRVDHTNSSSATADDSIPAFPCAVTSIAFAPRRIRNKLVLAIGLEDGGISLVIGDPATSGPSAEVRRGNTNGPNGGLAPSPNKMPFAATAGTTGSSWVTLCVVPALDAHVGAVRAMAWRPWRSQIEGGNEGTRSHNGDEREPEAPASPVLSFFGLSLAERDDGDDEADGAMTLGSCGMDQSVRLFTVKRSGSSIGHALEKKGEKSPSREPRSPSSWGIFGL